MEDQNYILFESYLSKALSADEVTLAKHGESVLYNVSYSEQDQIIKANKEPVSAEDIVDSLRKELKLRDDYLQPAFATQRDF